MVPAMQRPSGLNIDDLHDRQMNINVLSTEELGDSRIVRKCRQVARVSEPEQRICTTLVEGVEKYAASSKDSIIGSTLVTQNEQGRLEKRRARSHDGNNSTKQRGRPRLNTADSTPAEASNFSITVAAGGADIDS
jgi:hypothetical protein